jgi:hypothetical protein
MRLPAVHVYDVVVIHDYAYASRRSVIHAYDIVAQQDSADKSRGVAISVMDILEAPFELVTVSALPVVHADDLSIIYDLGVSSARSISAFDRLITDGASYGRSHSPLFFVLFQRRVPIRYRTLSVFDIISVADNVLHIKSYSPLFFALSQRRVPIRYLTLSVSDVVAVSESADFRAVKAVPASDYVVFDSAEHRRSHSPLFFVLFQRRVPIRYLTLDVADDISVFDSASLIAVRVVSVFDVVVVVDYAAVKDIAVHARDYGLVYDYVPHMHPRDVRYRSLYANIGMRTVSVFDKVAPHESVWVGPRMTTIHVRDHLISDYASVESRMITVHVGDYLATDRATVVRRSVHAYDIIQIRDNANIVRIT